ncbi:MAG: hypothetical protein K1X72_16625 [Pyrinomonadaceae bacterium]|nr:hypothetical protein [Pyrinomonadaceae bacterium]
MKFDKGIAKKYRKSIEDAFQTILDKGNDSHKRVMKLIIDSKMTICCFPVSKVNASGITGVTNPHRTNERIMSERLSLLEAAGEVFITIAQETIDTGGQQGCEGTFVHEGRHAFDFAQAISSFSDTDINPLSIFNPTRYELEWEAHITSGDYLLRIGTDSYIKEGLDLMILGEKNGNFFVSEDGIKRRLLQSYNMSEDGNRGEPVNEMFGLKIK